MFEFARAHGLDKIELSSGMNHEPEIHRLLEKEIELGEIELLIHNYFPAPAQSFVLNIASLDAEGLEKTKIFAECAINLASKVGASFYSIHAGFAANLRPEHLGKPGHLADVLTEADIDRDTAYQIMVATTRELAEHAAELGLSLLVENNVISPVFLEKMPLNPLLLTEAREITRFFKDVGKTNVGLLLDVGHARVSANAQGWSLNNFIDAVGDHVQCLHLSDNDGITDSNQSVVPDSWFLPQLKHFKNCEMVIEVYDMNYDDMRQQIDLIQNWIV